MEKTGARAVGLIATLAIMPCSSTAALANDHPAPQDWKDQETWSQFTDSEQAAAAHRHGSHPASATSSAAAPAQKSGLTPLLHPEMSSGSSGGFTVPGYVMMPGAQSAPVPIQHEETTIIPVVRPGLGGSPYGFNPLFGGGWQGGYGAFNPGWSHGHHDYGGWAGNLGGGYYPNSPQMVGFRKETRFVQTAPSKSSGNYYSPSTPDPTSSGSYYASPAGTATAMPIIQQETPQKDFWGPNGNPMQEDARHD